MLQHIVAYNDVILARKCPKVENVFGYESALNLLTLKEPSGLLYPAHCDVHSSHITAE